MEYKVYQVILLRKSLSIFIETGPDARQVFSFRGRPDNPQFGLETLPENPFENPRFAGSKLLGYLPASDLHRAWAACHEYAFARLQQQKQQQQQQRINNSKKHNNVDAKKLPNPLLYPPDIEAWCVECAAMLQDRKLVVPRPWWLVPGDCDQT